MGKLWLTMLGADMLVTIGILGNLWGLSGRRAPSHRNGAGSSRIEAVLKSLAELIRAQETELASLRKDQERFAELRKLIGRI